MAPSAYSAIAAYLSGQQLEEGDQTNELGLLVALENIVQLNDGDAIAQQVASQIAPLVNQSASTPRTRAGFVGTCLIFASNQSSEKESNRVASFLSQLTASLADSEEVVLNPDDFAGGLWGLMAEDEDELNAPARVGQDAIVVKFLRKWISLGCLPPGFTKALPLRWKRLLRKSKSGAEEDTNPEAAQPFTPELSAEQSKESDHTISLRPTTSFFTQNPAGKEAKGDTKAEDQAGEVKDSWDDTDSEDNQSEASGAPLAEEETSLDLDSLAIDDEDLILEGIYSDHDQAPYILLNLTRATAVGNELTPEVASHLQRTHASLVDHPNREDDEESPFIWRSFSTLPPLLFSSEGLFDILHERKCIFHTLGHRAKDDWKQLKKSPDASKVDLILLVQLPEKVDDVPTSILWDAIVRPTDWESVNAIKGWVRDTHRSLKWKADMAVEIETLGANAILERESRAQRNLDGRLLDMILSMVMDRVLVEEEEDEKDHYEFVARAHVDLKKMWFSDFGSFPAVPPSLQDSLDPSISIFEREFGNESYDEIAEYGVYDLPSIPQGYPTEQVGGTEETGKTLAVGLPSFLQ